MTQTTKTSTSPTLQICKFDDEHHHIADGPPYLTTLCGINVEGQQPINLIRRPICPICEALEKYYYNR